MGKLSTVNAYISPDGNLEILSQSQINQLCDASRGGLYEVFRQCSLAVLSNKVEIHNCREVLQLYPDFSIQVIQQERGIKLSVKNAPAEAFVDGRMIRGMKENLFAVLRDIVFTHTEIETSNKYDLNTSEGITNAVFQILHNARVLRGHEVPNIVACWGGHSVPAREYNYAREVGYQLGLRGIHICTGCGPGAMKGPMKGAAIAHAEQRNRHGRYIGISEPGIIAAEAPNPIVNELVIMPDLEKRMEAFIRLSHGIIMFPGGVGTAQELCYFLGILLNSKNAGMRFPFIFTGPKTCQTYFDAMNRFVEQTLGLEAQQLYRVIIDDPVMVAREMRVGLDEVRAFREVRNDAFYFNWLLEIESIFQKPFDPTHEITPHVRLDFQQDVPHLAANLNRFFATVVAGNVKEKAAIEVTKRGPFEFNADPKIASALEELLAVFISANRMQMGEKHYKPCYKIHPNK